MFIGQGSSPTLVPGLSEAGLSSPVGSVVYRESTVNINIYQQYGIIMLSNDNNNDDDDNLL